MATVGAAIDPLKPPFSAMRTERDRFAALAFCWADILLELNGDTVVVYAAGASRALIGRDARELVGKSLHNIVVPQDRRRLEGLLSVARNRGRIENQSVRLRGKKGPTPPLALTGFRLDDLNGHYFLALRTSLMARKDDELVGLVRDRATGLYDGDSFV
jgi:PAS domain S-box-containing protein